MLYPLFLDSSNLHAGGSNLFMGTEFHTVSRFPSLTTVSAHACDGMSARVRFALAATCM